MINDSRIMNLVKQKIIYNIFIMKNVLKNLNIIIINFVLFYIYFLLLKEIIMHFVK